MRKVHVSSSVNVRVDDNVCYRFVVCALACVADNIPVFFKHIHCLSKVSGVLEKCTSAQLVQVILPDLLNVFRAYFVQYSLSLDRSEVNISETVSIYRLLSEILTDLDSVTERIKRDTILRWLNTIQSTLDAVNDTAQAEQLSERYLISEVMELPEQAEDQVYYQLLKMAGKSMLEQIGEVERERLEYKEYIEQWIHEIKTPITAMKLLCENHRMDWTKELLLELEKTNRFTEQALYYARSEHTEKDYSVREMALSQVVHQAIADNKYLLLQSGMRLEVEEMQDTVYSDEKWVRFILNQLIANAVKYRTEQPVLRISTHKRQDQVVLVVEDNGIGIAASDLPRIFEKGFTGQNGRMVQQSTGIGLYLCKRLCEKLGIGITAESSEHGTAISLSFHINCLIHEVQS